MGSWGLASSDQDGATESPLQVEDPPRSPEQHPRIPAVGTVQVKSEVVANELEHLPNGAHAAEIIDLGYPCTAPQDGTSKGVLQLTDSNNQQNEAGNYHSERERSASKTQDPVCENIQSNQNEQSSESSDTKLSTQQTSSRTSPYEDASQRENLQSIFGDYKSLTSKPKARSKRTSQNKRAHNDEISYELPFVFVIGPELQSRVELGIEPDLICRHSPYIRQLCEHGKDFRGRRQALKFLSNKLKQAIISAGDDPHVRRPRTEHPTRPLWIYAKAIVDACNDYPWAKTCDGFSIHIAKAFGVPDKVIQSKRQQHAHLLSALFPVFADIDLPMMHRAIKRIYSLVTRALLDTGDNYGPNARVRAAAFNRFYLPNADPATVELLIEHLETPSSTSLAFPAPQLIRLALLAAHLRMPDVLNSIVDSLRQVSRHKEELLSAESVGLLFRVSGAGKEGETEEQAPRHAPRHALTVLRRLMVDVLVWTEPESDKVLGMMRESEDKEMACCVAESLYKRSEYERQPDGVNPPYFNPQESCTRYHVHEGGKSCF